MNRPGESGENRAEIDAVRSIGAGISTTNQLVDNHLPLVICAASRHAYSPVLQTISPRIGFAVSLIEWRQRDLRSHGARRTAELYRSALNSVVATGTRRSYIP
jgi:hypothetical protein